MVLFENNAILNARFPEGSRGRAESSLVASAEAKLSAKQEKARKALFLPATRNLFFVESPMRSKGPEGFQRATGKPFGRLRRGEIS